MADVTTDVKQSRAMRIARKRVEGFSQQFGEAHHNLARHAAFPLVLTPDLLYQIWANFVPEAPWVAVAHVLLSRLCQQVGYEMYEIDIADRNLLLRELKEEFGQEKFDELGEFLLDYVAQQLTDDDSDTQDLREAQEWTALAYTKPDKAARELAQRLSEMVQQEDMGEVLRLASLVETLAEPLIEKGFQPLLVYSQGMKSFFYGDLNEAVAQLEEIVDEESQLWVSDINLSIPEEIKDQISESFEPEVSYLRATQPGLETIEEAIRIKDWEKLDERWIRASKTSVEILEQFWQLLEIPEDDFVRICKAVDVDWQDVIRVIRSGGHFSTLRTKFTDEEILKATLRELGITVKTYADVRGYDGQRVRADVVAVLEGEYDIGFARNSDGSFDLVADLWGLAEKHNQTELINSIHQKYTVNKTLAEVKQRSGVTKKKKCPRCDSNNTVKYGYFQGKQNYKCGNCGTQFIDI